MSAFVIGGHSLSALAVVRSLGRAGIDVRLGEFSRGTLAGASRFVRSRVLLPEAASRADALEAALREEALAHPGRVWIPMTDEILDVVDGIRDRLPGALLPFPDSPTLALAWDKGRLLEAAAKAGIRSPATLQPESAAQLEAALPALRFPVILKPRRSKWRSGSRFLVGSVRQIGSPAELIPAWEAVHREIPRPLVQEFIPGYGMGVFVLADGGKVLARFSHRRLREKPPWGGVSVLRESAPFPEALRAPVDALMSALAWRGVGMIEFRIDERDGTPYLMEINPRFWGSLQLAVDAGLDFPRLLHGLALGEPPRDPGYRIGVRSRWLLGDLDHLLIRLRRGGSPHALPPHLPRSRWGAVLAFLNPFAGREEVFNINDPGPALFEWRHYLDASRPRPVPKEGAT